MAETQMNRVYVGEINAASAAGQSPNQLSLGAKLGTQTIQIGSVNSIGTEGNHIKVSNQGITIQSSKGNAIQQIASCKSKDNSTSSFVELSNTIGNKEAKTSMSTTYNIKKNMTTGDILCYEITPPTESSVTLSTCGYFEIIISGCNATYGGYSYKGFFAIKHLEFTPVSTLFSLVISPVIKFTVVGRTITLSINTALNNGSTEQSFIATLMSYPTLSMDGALNDFTVTAI